MLSETLKTGTIRQPNYIEGNFNYNLIVIIVKNCFLTLPLSSATLLLTDQDVSGSIPDSAVGFFSSGELFHSLCGLGVCGSQCASCSVLQRFRKMTLSSANHRSGVALQLCTCSCIWSIETSTLTLR